MRKLSIFAMLTLIFIINNCSDSTKSNSSSNPAEYTGIDKSLYQDVFIEDFNNNDNNWEEGVYDSCTISLNNGYYKIESNHKYYRWAAWQNITELDETSDFEIEAKIKTTNNSSGGIFWGLSSESTQFKCYIFSIQDQQYEVIDDQGEENKYWTSLTNTSYLNSSSIYNKLTIRKYQNKYYFFVNEELVDSHNFQDFYGSYTGINISTESTVEVDYFYIYHIGE